MKKILQPFVWASVLLAALGVGSWVWAVGTAAKPGDSEPARDARDRAQIDALMWHYVRALDTLNENAYADCYTADGRFGSGSRAARGREALMKIITDVKRRRAEAQAKGQKSPKMYHVITNQNLEFRDHDHARLYSYWMTVFAATDPGSQPRVAAVGWSTDDLVRAGGHWLIQARDVAPPD